MVNNELKDLQKKLIVIKIKKRTAETIKQINELKKTIANKKRIQKNGK